MRYVRINFRTDRESPRLGPLYRYCTDPSVLEKSRLGAFLTKVRLCKVAMTIIAKIYYYFLRDCLSLVAPLKFILGLVLGLEVVHK